MKLKKYLVLVHYRGVGDGTHWAYGRTHIITRIPTWVRIPGSYITLHVGKKHEWALGTLVG